MKLDIFLLNSIIPCLLAFVLWMNRSKRSTARLFLSYAMLNVSITFFIFYQYLSSNFALYTYVHPIGVALVLFIYPSFYQYVLFLTGYKKVKISIFLPGILFGLGSAIMFWGFLSAHDRIYFLSSYRTHKTFDSLALQINMLFRFANIFMVFIQIVWFYIATLSILKKNKRIIINIYSNAGSVSFHWMQVINISFLVSAIACVSLYVINPARYFGSIHVLEYPFYVLAFIISLLGAIGVSQNEVPEELVVIINTTEIRTIQEDENNTAVELMLKIENYFETEKPFLNPELNISQISIAIGTNRSYVSKCINSIKGQNFSQFVNTHRIAYAKSLLKDENVVSISEIAFQSGFGSLDAFNRTFKNNEKLTPKEYRTC